MFAVFYTVPAHHEECQTLSLRTLISSQRTFMNGFVAPHNVLDGNAIPEHVGI